MRRFKQNALLGLYNWINIIQRYKYLVIFFAVLLSGLALNYTVNNLGMNTDTKDMLSPELPWRKLDLEYERHFPQYTDNILIIIEAATPDQALDGADLFYQKLRKEKALFKSIYYPNELSIFKKSALLFLDINELQDLSDNLSAIQPFLYNLTEDPTLRGLFTMLSEAIDALEDGEDFDLDPLLVQINQAVTAALEQKTYRLSWHQLMSGEKDNDSVYREFILLQPILDYNNLFPAQSSMDKVHQLTDELNIEKNIGARIRITGSAALAHEELLTVTRGTGIALILALSLVTLIMLIGLGSLRLVFATLITLVIGLIFTAAFATFAIGSLNLISVAFAILYIGLGVDFAIHYCLWYRERIYEGIDNHEAINISSMHIGSSLFLCAVTTAIGFFAFIPTEYDGVAELGLISGFGMFISLIVTLTLLPALLSSMPLKSVIGKPLSEFSSVQWILSLPEKHAKSIIVGSLILVLVLLGLMSKIRFDYNTLNLQNPKNESVQAYQDLLADSDTSPWTGIILAKGKREAQGLLEKLGQLPLVEKVVWIEDFIPDNQDEKLVVIDEMSLLLGDLSENPDLPAITDTERLNTVQKFVQQLKQSPLTISNPILLKLQHSLGEYVDLLSIQDAKQQASSLRQFENSLLASLPGRLDTLRNSLNAEYITHDTLPTALEKRWHSAEDDYLLEIYPRENIQDNDAMRRFVEQLQEVEPNVIGSPVINLEASDAVVHAFKQAFLYAFIVITLFLLILQTHKRDTIFIIAPLIMAAICTGGISVLFDLPLNFANIIALPLLLGIGVDSGIHIMHRFRRELPNNKNLLATSSARAVVVSALTSIGSIGILAFSQHTGTASMGKILTIGIAITLVCMLIVLPSFLSRHIHQEY